MSVPIRPCSDLMDEPVGFFGGWAVQMSPSYCLHNQQRLSGCASVRVRAPIGGHRSWWRMSTPSSEYEATFDLENPKTLIRSDDIELKKRAKDLDHFFWSFRFKLLKLFFGGVMSSDWMASKKKCKQKKLLFFLFVQILSELPQW